MGFYLPIYPIRIGGAGRNRASAYEDVAEKGGKKPGEAQGPHPSGAALRFQSLQDDQGDIGVESPAVPEMTDDMTLIVDVEGAGADRAGEVKLKQSPATT